MIKSLDNFTENILQGNGVFDRIMGSVELHIHDEFVKNRITGTAYAQAYIQAMQAVLQAATQITLESDKIELELEKLKLEIEKTKAEIEHVQAQVELAKIQAEVAKVNKELVHWQAVAEQAKTCDIVDNGEETYSGDSTNIHGVTRQILEDHKATRDNTNKTTLLNFAEKVVLGPYGIIESSEGVGASYYGLNGANAISIINAVRKAYGVPELNTDKYSGDHKEYMDTYAPDVTLESED